MEIWSQEFLIGYIWYLIIPALIYFSIVQSEQIKENKTKVWWFVAIAFILLIYYNLYVTEKNKADCILSYYDSKELYSKDDIISKCIK